MTDCTCSVPGLCGACTPGHTEGKHLAQLMAKFAPEPASEIMDVARAEQYMSEVHGGAPRGVRAGREARDLWWVAASRLGIVRCQCGGAKKTSGNSFGRHTPTPRQVDIPSYTQKPRGKR